MWEVLTGRPTQCFLMNERLNYVNLDKVARNNILASPRKALRQQLAEQS